MSDWTFFRRVLIVAAIVVLALLIWQLLPALLLLFAAVLFALMLDGGADFVERHTPLSRSFALALVILAIVGLLGGVLFQFGGQIMTQLDDVAQRLPGAIASLQTRLGVGDITGKLMEELRTNTGSILIQITSAAGFLINLVGNLLLVFVAAVFLAAQPDLYHRGVLMLVPNSERDLFADTLDTSASALKQWLLAQLIAMMMVGALTGIGLWLIGLPSPLALGLISALAEFIPIVGPILGAIPAVLLAVSIDWTTAIWTIGVVVVVQQLESNLIMPLIQQKLAALPPVVTMFAILAFGLLFGPVGLVLATPLAVLCYVLVTKLYIRELLDEPAKVPGEDDATVANAA
ncbi:MULTISPECIES: AI-2E family transporter [Rhodomicrobium]|uniref:AI-2E family transporter n=1 Tax=Rhodomicrobium TaxID=1068 RepID=UPI0014833455|nr:MULTISPECIES: AI-2E family transporter [Rhodomicrobium]